MFLDTKTLFPYLHNGEVYGPFDPDLFDAQRSCLKYINDFNASPYDAVDYRDELLRKMCWSIGEGCFIEAPMRSNFGCNHLILGNNVYVNYDACFVDDTFITIGDNTMIGPRCVIATASHPEDPELRALGYQLNKPVTIGKNVWLGANVTVCPGVTIGDNSIIGAGSVVVKDIPANVVAVGNPCKVIREVRKDESKRQPKL